jgi:hypothetical protein
MKYEVGQRIRARRRITEGGWDCPGKPGVKFPDENYIHAEPNDLGCIKYVDPNGMPSAKFCRTQTETIVSDEEIEVLTN